MSRAALRLHVFLLLLAVHAAAQSTIKFGVLGLFHPRQLELSPVGAQPLRITGLSQPLVLNREPGSRRLLLRAEGDRVLLSGSRAVRLEVSARDGLPVRFQLAVPGKLERVYQGTLHVTASHGELLAIVSMDRETAVATIVASEMPLDAPLEALKAQAVVTRSFLAAGPRHEAFDFCDTTHCQYLRSPDEATPRVRAAVEDTRGLMLTWHSRVIAALYSSRCGGRTRSLQEAGMNPGGGYPYYAVACAWCHNHPAREETRTPAAQEDQTRVPLPTPNHGHGLGLCQFGAIGMARAGADFRSILAHYYPNADLTRPASLAD